MFVVSKSLNIPPHSQDRVYGRIELQLRIDP